MSMEDSGAEGDLDHGCLAQEVSENNNISMWHRDQFCDIFAKNVAAFCLSKKKNLPEAKFKLCINSFSGDFQTA